MELDSQITRTILVIEEELDIREIILFALNREHWNAVFKLTEVEIEESLPQVAGVIMDWDVPELNRDRILGMIRDKPLIITSASGECEHPDLLEKPYSLKQLTLKTNSKFNKDKIYLGDPVTSKMTPDWGVGTVDSIFSDEFFIVKFGDKSQKCHRSGLKLAFH